MARWVVAKVQVKLAKKAKTCSHCYVTNRKPQTQIRRLAESVEAWAKFCCKMWGDSLVCNQYILPVDAEVKFY